VVSIEGFLYYFYNSFITIYEHYSNYHIFLLIPIILALTPFSNPFSNPFLSNPINSVQTSKKRSAFDGKGPKGVSGPNAVRMLQTAEQHHLELADNFAYVLEKLSRVGGKHYVDLSNVVDDLANRVKAAHDRVLNLEKVILEG